MLVMKVQRVPPLLLFKYLVCQFFRDFQEFVTLTLRNMTALFIASETDSLSVANYIIYIMAKSIYSSFFMMAMLSITITFTLWRSNSFTTEFVFR